MKVRLTGPVSATAASLGLKTWVKHKSFPRKQYFEWIDLVLERLKVLSPDAEPEQRNIVTALVSMLDEEGALLARAAEKKGAVEYDTDEKWLKICTAAGWAILAEYASQVEDGSWPE